MKPDTKSQILNSAERLTKLKGFAAFSYRDIAKEVEIKTSSIHYYFPTKSDLAEALVDRYTQSFSEIFEDISRQESNGYCRIKVLFENINCVSGIENNLCLCGMLSANIHTISDAVRGKLNNFFELFETWIEKLLKEGIDDGSIHGSVRPKSTATEIVTSIEGTMLIARVRSNKTYLRDTLDLILARLRS